MNTTIYLENLIMKRLNKELGEAIYYSELLKGTNSEKELMGYVVGIKFALDVIVGNNPHSILESGINDTMKEMYSGERRS